MFEFNNKLSFSLRLMNDENILRTDSDGITVDLEIVGMIAMRHAVNVICGLVI